ncbi:MAG: tRNA (adenosine(37)-N6)-dimethylallyltransferase MiaA [Patescibacteria group bacterium]
MQKLLVICGPTSTGKTTLALKLAKKFNGEIISADSRQVYKGMDIGTGKEWGEGVKIWGYDLVDPTEEFNISEYLNFAKVTMSDIQKRRKLPILVGGTGFYIKGIIDGIPTVNIPKNIELRNNLENITTSELFGKLAELDPEKAGGMNSSDKKNPRRLVRAIEIAQYMLDHKSLKAKVLVFKNNILMIGLSSPTEFVSRSIDSRVDKRVASGIKEEIKKLLKNGLDWNAQSMFSLGYRQWRDYFEGEVEEARVIDDWKREEKKYAKRQMTWFKKDKRIKWFNIADISMAKDVENEVKLWHNRTNDKKS